MAFTALQDHNPFMWITTLTFGVLLLRYYLQRTGRYRLHGMDHTNKSSTTANLGNRRRLPLLRRLQQTIASTVVQPKAGKIAWITLLVTLPLAIAFEMYYQQYSCKVSEAYFNQNVALLQHVTSILTALEQPWWLDYATLLSQVRKQQSINIWDHDADVSIITPGSHVTLPPRASEQFEQLVPKKQREIESIQELLGELGDNGLYYVYRPERHLIQVYTEAMRGPHVDIWMWDAMPTEDRQEVFLYTIEPNINYPKRPLTQIFPLQNVEWKNMLNSCYIPNDAHQICLKEFAPYGGDYMVPQVFRGDCFHNFFNLRFL